MRRSSLDALGNIVFGEFGGVRPAQGVTPQEWEVFNRATNARVERARQLLRQPGPGSSARGLAAGDDLWGEPVDWSECVADPVPAPDNVIFLDTSPKTLTELRSQEFDLCDRPSADRLAEMAAVLRQFPQKAAGQG